MQVILTWYPEYRGRRNGKAQHLSPGRIVIVTHSDGRVSHEVEHKDELWDKNDKTHEYLHYIQCTYQHECRSKEDPADVPIPADSVPDHLLDTEVQLSSSKHPADGDSLEKHTPQQRQTTGSIKVHQLENVHSSLRN